MQQSDSSASLSSKKTSLKGRGSEEYASPASEEVSSETLVDTFIQLPLKLLGYVFSIFTPPQMSNLASYSSESLEQSEGQRTRRSSSMEDEDMAKIKVAGMSEALQEEPEYLLPSDKETLRTMVELGIPVSLVGREEERTLSSYPIPYQNSYPGTPLSGSSMSREAEYVLNDSLVAKLRLHLPARSRLASKWSLLYSSYRDGFSLSTLFSSCKKYGNNYPCLLAIRDANGDIFGAYTSHSWAPHIGHYGSGECFLWKKSTNDNDIESVAVFKPTGKNQFYMISETDFMAVGCGDSLFGLWLDEQLLYGNSNKVPTFDNEILSHESSFECVSLELWELDISV